MNISGKVDMICRTLHVNTACGTALGPIGIVSLIMDTEKHSFKCNFIICITVKQPLIIGLDFSQRYKLDIDWDTTLTMCQTENSYCDKKR